MTRDLLILGHPSSVVEAIKATDISLLPDKEMERTLLAVANYRSSAGVTTILKTLDKRFVILEHGGIRYEI
jgi:hypothetical protein